MTRRSHPARQARVLVGVAGSVGFVAMVGTISEASTQVLATDLTANLDLQAIESVLELQGSATPAGDVTNDAPVMTEDGSSSDQVAEDGSTSVPAADGGSSSVPVTEAATPTETSAALTTTTVAGADQTATVTPEETTPAETAPAETAPTETTANVTTTTAAPETDTTSSGS